MSQDRAGSEKSCIGSTGTGAMYIQIWKPQVLKQYSSDYTKYLSRIAMYHKRYWCSLLKFVILEYSTLYLPRDKVQIRKSARLISELRQALPELPNSNSLLNPKRQQLNTCRRARELGLYFIIPGKEGRDGNESNEAVFLGNTEINVNFPFDL